MRNYRDLEPQEIFVDAATQGMSELQIERPLTRGSFFIPLALALSIVAILIAQTFTISVTEHQAYVEKAERNKTNTETVIAERGALYDRNGVVLAINTASTTGSTTVMLRKYPYGEATAQLIGYVSYPKRDSKGVLFQSTTEGVIGIEKVYNEQLSGVNGIMSTEEDAKGASHSGVVLREPQTGPPLTLSIDADLQKEVYEAIKERVDVSFQGGAAAIMDVNTGELVALASYPSYDPEVLSLGYPKEKVSRYMNDPRSPFVDRAVTGLYAPGSIVKPFVALAALHEKVVTPEKTFISTGKLVIPNPYNPEKPSVYKDWRAHGAVDMRRAIAVSSDVYFYIVGGGFQDQKGLGITRLDEYARKFGFGSQTGFADDSEPAGIVPTPEWKAENFNGDPWRVGDTYISSIGQFGWQLTLLQAVRATAAIANGGTLVTPTVIKGDRGGTTELPFTASEYAVVREGMRRSVTEGTAQALSTPAMHIAAKTGTAEVGERKEYTNSLIIGFFPYEKPKYAFAIILEKAHAGTTQGAPAAMRNILTWIVENRATMTVASK